MCSLRKTLADTEAGFSSKNNCAGALDTALERAHRDRAEDANDDDGHQYFDQGESSVRWSLKHRCSPMPGGIKT